jgi:hypothetical protein
MDRESIAVLIAALSFAVSMFSLWRQQRVAGRAHFTAEWETSSSLIYVNHGPGAARDVQVNLKSEVRPVNMTIPYIGAFQTMRIEVLRAFSEKPVDCLKLSWKDNGWRRQDADVFLPDPPVTHTRPQARDGLEKAVRAIARQETEEELKAVARRAASRRFL